MSDLEEAPMDGLVLGVDHLWCGHASMTMLHAHLACLEGSQRNDVRWRCILSIAMQGKACGLCGELDAQVAMTPPSRASDLVDERKECGQLTGGC
eukprot:6485524-Amphidinium_carterae.1